MCQGSRLFSGKVSDNVIEGTFVQGGATLPFRLERGTRQLALERPQHPEPPYPYLVEEISVKGMDGVQLGCTLTLPEGGGRRPAVVLLSGSGAQDRDGTIFEHKPLLVLADHLARNGVAGLRCDDRGVGNSGGRLDDTPIEQLANDAVRALELLARRSEVDSRRTGLIGHSAGAMDATVAVAKSGDADFLVLLAPAALPADEILLQQNADALRVQGFDEHSIDAQLGVIRRLFGQVRTGASAAEIRPTLVQLFRLEADGLARALSEADSTNMPEERADQELARYAGTWFRSFLQYDPQAMLKRVRVPVLALFGGRDFQVGASMNQKALVDALAAGGNGQVQAETLPGLNHLFQPAVSGLPSEYGLIETTIDPGVLDRITDFVFEVPSIAGVESPREARRDPERK